MKHRRGRRAARIGEKGRYALTNGRGDLDVVRSHMDVIRVTYSGEDIEEFRRYVEAYVEEPGYVKRRP